MLKIISKNKQGNKIISYTVSDGSQSRQLTKDQVASLIKQKKISNATIQNYKNQVIIRVKDITETQTNYKQAPANKPKALTNKPKTTKDCLSREQQLYEASKNIYNRWKLSRLPFEKLIEAWNQYCKQVNYTDPFEYDIDTPEYRKILGLKSSNATNLIISRYIGHSNISKGTIIPYFVQSTFCMFEGCKAQSLDLSSFNTSKVTDMSRMFYYCEAQSIDLSSFNTSNVTNMSYMFDECHAQSLDLSSFNTSKVTDMEDMFSYCQAQSLDLSSFNTLNVTNMSYMFYGCKVQFLDLSFFNTSNVTDMSAIFKFCKAQSIDLSSFNTSNVISMAAMFSYCQAQSLDLSSFNTSKVTDMSFIFNSCEAQYLDLSLFDTSNVTDMSAMFDECHAQSILLSKSCDNLLSVIPNYINIQYK